VPAVRDFAYPGEMPRAFVALVAMTIGGCGGAAAARPASEVAAGSSPAAQCLAIADAQHERRPNEPAKVVVKHALVKYAGAKRAAPTVTRTREEACLRAQEARSKLQQGTSFADIVKEYSEEPGAATREGSLGAIERSQMVAARTKLRG